MTCDQARAALLESDLPPHDHSSPDLARHLRRCAECAAMAEVLERHTRALGDIVRRRTRTRRRLAAVAVASTLAAAVVVAVVRVDRARPPAPVNDSRRGIVSVEVPRGKTAMVLQTKDTAVTIVWLTEAPRGGI